MHITKKTESSISEVRFDQLEFGKVFTDHMVQCSYKDGAWGELSIGPLEPLTLHPATHVFHYGQAIFEGLKAYRMPDGKINIFRARDNVSRLNRSAKRMAIPQMDEEKVMQAMHAWMDLDRDWVPRADQGSLYIRPFIIATSPTLRAVPSLEFRFMLIASPVGFYYDKPIRVKVEEHYTRAAQGGVGAAKAAGNYGAAFMPSMKANAEGFNQLVWTDRTADRNLEELGSANIFLALDDGWYTPSLHDSILAGITRDSVITLGKEAGVSVFEQPIPHDMLEDALKQGRVKGMFATGTAAAVTMIREIDVNGVSYSLDHDTLHDVKAVAERLNNIKLGIDSSHPEWMYTL